jgi:hypothetical protein
MATWKKVIVSGSVAELSASLYRAPGQPLQQVTNLAATTVLSGSFSGSFVGNFNIGAAEDGTYNDGLFTDFTTSTPVGTAVDRFNEVLKGLAPLQAPLLDYIDATSNSTMANSQRLSFDATNTTASYSPMSGSTTGFADITAFTTDYTQTTGDVSNLRRLGVIASSVNPVIITLNNDVAGNTGTYTNYPNNAFRVTDSVGVGETYTLNVNGVNYSYTPPDNNAVTTATIGAGPATITLAKAQTGSFISSGQEFTLWQHRTGTVSIPTSMWRSGSNYAVVSSSLGVSSAYIDWVYDPIAVSGNTTFPYTIATPTSASIDTGSIVYLSGIPYCSKFDYTFTSSIDNYYRNTFATTAISANSTTQGFNTFQLGGAATTILTAMAVTITTPTSPSSSLQVASLHSVNSSQAINGSTLSSRFTVTNAHGKTNNSSAVTTPKVIVNRHSNANTTTSETFTGENYRLAYDISPYNDQGNVTTYLNAYPSASSLVAGDQTDELAVWLAAGGSPVGRLTYPTKAFGAAATNGNISGIGALFPNPNFVTHPDYSAASGTRYYLRAFQNGASVKAIFTIAIAGSGLSFVAESGVLSNNVKVSAKIPGTTAWRDVIVGYPGSTNAYPTDTDNTYGCGQGISTNSTNLAGAINFVTQNAAANQYVLIRITAGSSWTGHISSISLT